MIKSYNYQATNFMISVPDIQHLPIDSGAEIVFVGRSNSGKSSLVNTLTNQKNLAFSSKTPGRTNLINLFEVEPGIRLVDFPGYGYNRVSKLLKRNWQCILKEYLHKRFNLKGLILLTDIRHPMKDVDQQVLKKAIDVNIPVLILLTKADKILLNQHLVQLNHVRKLVSIFMADIEITVFSSFKKLGLNIIKEKLNHWLWLHQKQRSNKLS